MSNKIDWIVSKQSRSKFDRFGYCGIDRTLTIEWRDGTKTTFEDVSPVTFGRLKQSRSKTTFIRRELAGLEMKSGGGK